MGADGAHLLIDQRLVAVVATYNRRAEIQKTVARLLDEPCVGIVVVDNGSSDGTREWLKSRTSARVVPVFPEANLGGAGGFELGMQVARDMFDPDWVVVMDDDARPYPGAFGDFSDVTQEQWDILAAAVYYPDGHICEMNRPSRNPFWHRAEFVKTCFGVCLGQGRKGFHVPDQAYGVQMTLPVDAASFVGMFISRRVMEHIGKPDGKLFIYGDDVSYSLRARKAGFRIGFAPKIRFEHACSTFAQKKTYTPYWKVYYNYRNGLITYREAAGWLFPVVAPVFLLKWVLNGRHYGADKGIFYRLLWRAIKDGFANRRDLEHADLLTMVEQLEQRAKT
jgi:GT2 family glycosyltransferase